MKICVRCQVNYLEEFTYCPICARILNTVPEAGQMSKLVSALFNAAEYAYDNEVSGCGMEAHTLDEFFTKDDWLRDKINEWLGSNDE